ncbi:MAG: acetyl-CoA carboxylase carboxyl transferase subunit beta [Chloroflexi bacterium]|nr:MAG: acetyl-CoA carboxylase carboxyl transferase subunit beta [Chloroflexota bacterium]
MKDESRPALPVNSENGKHPEANLPSITTGTRTLPENLAVKCPGCRELLVGKDLEKNLQVCPRCGHHFRLPAAQRIEYLLDEDSFVELAGDLIPLDPLNFVSRSQVYREKLEESRAKSGLKESVVAGTGSIEGLPLALAVMDSRFIGGSMGSVAGEKITLAIEKAQDARIPLLIISASGGARMQEGLLSLMQMAKTSAALALLSEAGVPFISLLTDPTTGGVTASFASLGDIILAEPGALIGFTGPRVVEQFMHQRLPKDTDTSEFMLDHGMIDAIVHRRMLRPTLAKILRLYHNAEALSHGG